MKEKLKNTINEEKIWKSSYYEDKEWLHILL